MVKILGMLAAGALTIPAAGMAQTAPSTGGMPPGAMPDQTAMPQAATGDAMPTAPNTGGKVKKSRRAKPKGGTAATAMAPATDTATPTAPTDPATTATDPAAAATPAMPTEGTAPTPN